MTDVRQVLEQELPILSEIAAQAGDPGLSALLVAASNEQVQQIIVERLQEGSSYRGALLSYEGEQIQVVFSISRAEGSFGLLPLSVLVLVDLEERRVVSVVDHHLEKTTEIYSQSSLGSLRPELELTPLMRERGSKASLRPTQRLAGGPATYWV